MSDDASGPEDNAEQSHAEWKRDMAMRYGMPADINIDKLKFWENVKPLWRSDEVNQQQ